MYYVCGLIGGSGETLDPFNPHDASKHHFASMKNDLIS